MSKTKFTLKAVSEFGMQETFYRTDSIGDALNMARIWVDDDGPSPVEILDGSGAIVMDEAAILKAIRRSKA